MLVQTPMFNQHFFGGPPQPFIPGLPQDVVASPLVHNWDPRLNNFSYHDKNEKLITEAKMKKDDKNVKFIPSESQDNASSEESEDVINSIE